MRRGAFIVFEGIDRSGKSTQASLLVENLRKQGQQVEHVRFPDRTTPTGQIINDFLTRKVEVPDETIHLLYSANRWEKNAHIKNLLEQGITVVSDRYAYSGVVFTRAKGLDLEWSMNPDRGLVKPDKVIFMEMKSKDVQERPGFGDERYEVDTFQAKVRTTYYNLLELEAQNPSTADLWNCIDANRPIETIAEDLLQLALSTVSAVASSPLGKLWTQN